MSGACTIDTYKPVGSTPSGTAEAARSDARQLATVLVLFCVLPYFVYFYMWFGESVQTLGNAYLVYQPKQMAAFMANVREGHFPLWVPYDAGGCPLIRHTFGGLYWPVTWLLMSFEGSYQGRLIEFLDHVHLLSLGLCGFVTYLWLRRLGVAALAAFFGGAIFIFNTRMLDAFRFAMALDVVVWLPVLLYLLERMLDRPKRWFLVLYPLAQHVMLAPGHLQEALYCVLFVNLYAVVRGLLLLPHGTAQDRLTWFVKRAALFGGAQLLGLGISAVFVVPFYLDGLRLATVRHEVLAPGAEPFHYFFHITLRECVLNVFYPWYTSAWSNFYCSQIVWILLGVACLACVFLRKSFPAGHWKLCVFFASFAVLSMLYACGPETPVAPIVNACVPILKKVRVPGRVMTVGMFAFAAAVALALNLLLKKRPRWLINSIGLGCLVYVLAGVGLWVGIKLGMVEVGLNSVYLPILWYIPHSAPAWMNDRAPQMTQAMIAMIIATGFVNLLILCVHRRGRISFATTLAALMVGLFVESSFYHKQGSWYEAGKPRSAVAIDLNSVDFYHSRASQAPPFFAFWCYYADLNRPRNLKYLKDRAGGALYELLTEGGPVANRLFYQTIEGHEIPRAYLTPTATLVAGNGLSVLQGINPYHTAVIDTRDPVNAGAASDVRMASLASAVQTVPETGKGRFAQLNAAIDVSCYTYNKATFQVSAPHDALFNYNDMYDAGWRATVDGKPVPIYRSNHMFKSVVVPEGTHEIAFTYDPWTFKLGLVISLACLCSVVALASTLIPSATSRQWILGSVVCLGCSGMAWLGYHALYEVIHRDGFVYFNPELPVRVIQEGDYFQPPWGDI